MLYVTTRNNEEVYTAQRVLRENRAPDGGLYVPFRDPHFSESDIRALADKSFNRCVAEILNLLFQTHLTPWDVDFTIGRYAVRLQKLGQRIVVGESWHNLESDFSRLVNNLTKLLCGDDQTEVQSGDWVCIGVRIAVLFGIFGELIRQDIADVDRKIDISVVSGDFSAPISAWYARNWGLPIGNVICACNDNGNLWDFVCHGVFRTGEVAKQTSTPLADVVVPEGMERLICASGGRGEAARFLGTLRLGGTYYMDEAPLNQLRKGLYVTVTSERRMRDTIPTVFGTHQYVLSPYTALAYAGLQDYRARTGESRIALVLAERSPLCDAETVAGSLGITVDVLKEYYK